MQQRLEEWKLSPLALLGCYLDQGYSTGSPWGRIWPAKGYEMARFMNRFYDDNCTGITQANFSHNVPEYVRFIDL